MSVDGPVGIVGSVYYEGWDVDSLSVRIGIHHFKQVIPTRRFEFLLEPSSGVVFDLVAVLPPVCELFFHLLVEFQVIEYHGGNSDNALVL